MSLEMILDMILEIIGIIGIFLSSGLTIYSVVKNRLEKEGTISALMKYKARQLMMIASEIAREHDRNDPTGNDVEKAGKEIAKITGDYRYIVLPVLGEQVETNRTLYKLKLGVGVLFIIIGGLILLIAYI
jgi:hypothetical protein